jgi:hypothetical protein
MYARSLLKTFNDPLQSARVASEVRHAIQTYQQLADDDLPIAWYQSELQDLENQLSRAEA